MTKQVFFNGINGVTGEYITPPMSYGELTNLIVNEKIDKKQAKRMALRAKRAGVSSFGFTFDTDLSDVQQAGWAIIFHMNESDEVKNALSTLVAHRQKMIGNDKVKILDYRLNEPWLDWLDRHGATPGDADIDTIPYYILIIGEPSMISFEFSYLLSMDYAVGRLSFDTADEYRSYAESMVAYETGATIPTDKRAVVFGTDHKNVFPRDKSTELSCNYLAKPLAGLPNDAGDKAPSNIFDYVKFTKQAYVAEDATKPNLLSAIRNSPALLFTATHGAGFPKGNPGQLANQGALVCQEWPGPGATSKDFFFSAEDIPADAPVHGMVVFHFACYSAGTPLYEDFSQKAGQVPQEISDRPFIAALPKKLLSHINGSALAVIGHIERAWGNSITGMDPLTVKKHIEPFENTLGYLCTGKPVGYAVKDFKERTASLSIYLSQLLEDVSAGDNISDEDLASTWLGRNDARNYIVIGDPAVRLRVESMK